MRNVWKESASNTWNFLLAKNRCLPSLQCDILNTCQNVWAEDDIISLVAIRITRNDVSFH